MRDKIKFNGEVFEMFDVVDDESSNPFILKRTKLKEEDYYPYNITIEFIHNEEKKKIFIPHEELQKYIVEIEEEERND